MLVEATKCYICGSDRFVDKHHYDCQYGKLSSETVPLCRRCHITYHDWGIEAFSPDTTDKALEVENKRREISHLSPMKSDDIKRSNYWYKKHGMKPPHLKEKRGKAFPSFQLPHGEPLCGWEWVNEHIHDLIDWVPRIEIITPNLHSVVDVDNTEKLKNVVKVLRSTR